MIIKNTYTHTILLSLFFYWLSLPQSHAVVFPKDESVLIINQLVLEYEPVTAASRYLVLLSDTESHTRILRSESTTHTFLPIQNLSFGKKYYWRVTAFDAKNKPIQVQQYTFSIIASPSIENNIFRFNKTIKDDTSIYQNTFEGLVHKHFIAIDGANGFLALDMNYKIVLPEVDVIENLMRVHHNHFAYLQKGYKEVNIYGEIVAEIKPEFTFQNHVNTSFHHGFVELETGQIALLGFEKVPDDTILKYHWDTLSIYQNEKQIYASSIVIWHPEQGIQQYISLYKTLIDYLQSKPYKTSPNDLLRGGIGHLNHIALSADYRNFILTFRDFNSIVIMSRADEKVIDVITDKTAFTKPHSAHFIQDTLIAYYRNGSGTKLDTTSSARIYDTKNKQVVHTFTLQSTTQPKRFSIQKGDIQSMDSLFFINMGSVNSCFLVDKNGDQLWSCDFFKRQDQDTIANTKLGFSQVIPSLTANDLVCERVADRIEIQSFSAEPLTLQLDILYRNGKTTTLSVPLPARAHHILPAGDVAQLSLRSSHDLHSKTYRFTE